MSLKRVEDFGDLLTSGEPFIINQIGVIRSEMVDNNYSQRRKHLTDYPLILGNEGTSYKLFGAHPNWIRADARFSI